MTDWPFCDPATAPTRSTQDTPSTVCSGASSTLETGAFLDAMLVVQGPSQAQPEQQQSSDGDGDSEDGAVYGLVGASADATLVMSEWVSTDDNGWTKVGWSVVQFGGRFQLASKIFPSSHLSPTRSHNGRSREFPLNFSPLGFFRVPLIYSRESSSTRYARVI